MVRIPVTDNVVERHANSNGRSFDEEHAGVGSVAADMEGPAGEKVTGGDITPPQDAEEASEEHNRQRVANEEMEERQEAGEVDTQTKDLKPSAGNPDEGLPPNPHGSEVGGGTADEDATDDSGGAEISDSDETRAQLEETQQELDKTKAQLVQLAADFDNYRKMAARRESEIRERAARGVLEDLLPVLDNFERAVDSTKNARDVESVRVGIEYILKQFQQAMNSHGVEAIESHGQEFDPLRHDALERVADSGQPAGTVVEETQRGYTYRGQVLRPSRVKVAE